MVLMKPDYPGNVIIMMHTETMKLLLFTRETDIYAYPALVFITRNLFQ